MVSLKQIQDFCNNKSIAIVGNSEKTIGSNSGREIDSHDVVVRMNYAPQYLLKYSKDIGIKNHLYVAGISRIDILKSILKGSNPNFILFLAPWTPINKVLDYRIPNPYISTREEYAKIKEKFGEYKPSSGSLVTSFIMNNVAYRNIDLYGFDFFKTSDKMKRNSFNSFHYKDHSAELESEYINSILNEKIKLR